jgi:D-alanine-D-alanine ligase
VARVEAVAKGAHAALGLRDYARVDLRVDADGQPWVIDVNPNCDISPDAGVARAAAVAGMTYPQLVGEIAELAWKRYAKC